MPGDFHTFGEYMKKDDNTLTAAMEDYVEMIYRLSMSGGGVRIGELSQALNIQPPSATNMIRRLAAMGYISYKKYEDIVLEEKGWKTGRRLIRRHDVIEGFMRFLGISESEVLEETEKIEHTLSDKTVSRIENLTSFFALNTDLTERYNKYLQDLNNTL